VVRYLTWYAARASVDLRRTTNPDVLAALARINDRAAAATHPQSGVNHVDEVIAMPASLTPTEPAADQRSLYERDFYTWALEQARALKEHRLEDLDWENLSDEVESLAKSERRELRNRLEVLLEHLLKSQFQANGRSRSWRTTIGQQRLKIGEHLDENPGLKASAAEVLARAYGAARLEVTGRFLRKSDPQPPNTCPWSFEQVMDERFWPE
jgi:hypothetical protein